MLTLDDEILLCRQMCLRAVSNPRFKTLRKYTQYLFEIRCCYQVKDNTTRQWLMRVASHVLRPREYPFQHFMAR